MIPQTIRQIFQETGRLKEKGWTYSLQVRELADHHILNLFRLECFSSYILSPSRTQPFFGGNCVELADNPCFGSGYLSGSNLDFFS